MLESFNGNIFSYQKLSPEEQKQRGILGRLVGVIADTVNPTRNGRKYSADLWEKTFADPIMQEKIANKCVFGEISHPLDGRSEIDPEKIAVCLAEVPKKNSKGQLMGVFDVMSTPCGKILKTMLDYGTTVGVSSRGEGDTFTDFDGQEAVDPDTYQCTGFDIVFVPAVKEARLQYVTEELESRRKTLTESLNELVENASEEDRKIMQETLNQIKLNEEAYTKDELIDKFGTDNTDIVNAGNEEKVTEFNLRDWLSEHEQATKDCLMYFNTESLDEISEDNLKDWIAEHEQLSQDLDNFRKKYCIINEEGNKEPSSEDASIDVGNAESDVNIIDELHEALKSKKGLEENLIDLQEKLSVCYAKEAKQEERISTLTKAVANLTEQAQRVPSLEVKVKELNEELINKTKSLTNSNNQLAKLQESGAKLIAGKKQLNEKLFTRDNEITSLNKNIAQLNESVAEMTKDLELKTSQYSKKLENANKLVEKYQSIAKKAVDKYIESQALKIGCSVNEIKHKLPESYTFNDIDNVCEDVQAYKLEMSKLPFVSSKLPKEAKVEVKKTVVESVLPKSNDDDDIDNSLLSLAGLI